MSFDDFYDEYCVPKPVDPNLPTREDKFTAIMQACFDRAPNLELVRLKGYTPSFNDGDPCRHSRVMGYKLSGNIFYDEQDGYLFIDIDPEASLIDDDGNQWTWDETNQLDEKVYGLIANQSLDEDIWETNYNITVTRGNNGKVIINKEYYHPEY